MAAITDEQVERVRALVASIPPGGCRTYGDIAAAAGLSSPRIVGWIMRTDSSDLPWHRVITRIRAAGAASGDPAAGAAARRRGARGRRPGAAARSPPRVLRDDALRAGASSKHQPDQGRGAGQARERRRRRPRMQRVHRKPEHQRAQQHLRPLRQRRPALDEPVVGLAPGQCVDDDHAGRPGRRPPVRRDVGDARRRGARRKALCRRGRRAPAGWGSWSACADAASWLISSTDRCAVGRAGGHPRAGRQRRAAAGPPTRRGRRR